MSIPTWQYIASMFTYFMFLLFIIKIMRKHYVFANYFWIASLLTFPIWLMGSVEGWFRWSKMLSVMIPTIFVGFTRIANYEKRKGAFWKLFQGNGIFWFFYLVLFLNILEATIKDFTTGNIFNAACGFILCITIPFPDKLKFWNISTEKYGDIQAYTTFSWAILYTTWNACFVYNESHAYFASSLCILLAAVIYPIIKRRPELYLTARIYTLITHLLIRATFPYLFPALMDSSSWFNASYAKYWGIINFVVILPYLFWYLWQLHSNKAEVSFRRSLLKGGEIS